MDDVGIGNVKDCESLLHRIRTIQGKTNLNFAEPHFAGCNDAVDFKERIKQQQEILEKCRRRVADQLQRLHDAKRSSKTLDKNETGDYTESSSKNEPSDNPFKVACVRHVKPEEEEDVALTQSQAVTCLKLLSKATDRVKATRQFRKRKQLVSNPPEEAEKRKPEPPDISEEHHLTNIVNTAIARLNKAKSTVQKVTLAAKAKAKPKGILKGTSTSCMSGSKKLEHEFQEQPLYNSVMKAIDSGKKVARARSARLTSRQPQRLLKHRTRSSGCLLVSPEPTPAQNESTIEENTEVSSSKDVCKRVTKNTNKTLSTLNEEMSNTLQESIAYLNELCMRVRNCLTDIEADELSYQTQKYRQRQKQLDEAPLPSECDDLKKNARTLQVEELQYIPNSDQSFRLTNEPTIETTIEQVITTISLGNGEIRMDIPKVQAPPSSKQQLNCEQPKKNRKKNRHSRKPVGSSITKIDCPHISGSRLPIWQRQLPSIIDEIQQTVKKQATRTQYKEFLRTLKHLVQKDKAVLPPNVERVPNKDEKVAEVKQPVSAKLIKEVSEAKRPKCSHDCGIKVENLCPSDSLTPRQKLHWIKTRADMGNSSFQTYDILDEITPKDLEPIQSEYPRRDQMPSSSSKKVEDTLLYQLVYNRDPKVLEAFLHSTTFIDDAPRPDKRPMEKSTSETHITINRIESKPRPKSASNAYRLYERLEFDRLPPKKTIPGDLEIQVVEAPKSKPKPKKTDDKTQHVPASLQSIKSKGVKPRPERTAEEKLRLLNKHSSAKSMSKKGKKLSKDQIRPYLRDPNFKMKKILTIMPTLVDQRKSAKESPNRIFAVYPVQVKYQFQKSDGRQKTVKISKNVSEINEMAPPSSDQKRALESMTKRDVIRRLKPYIFMNLTPAEVTVLPVSTKQHNSKTSNDAVAKPSISKKTAWFHGDDCLTGKKLCKKCQVKCTDDFIVKTHMEPNCLQYWTNHRKPPGEHMVSVVVKNDEAKPPNKTKAKSTKANGKEHCRTAAANTRCKLKEVKKLVKKNDLLGKDLQDIIDTIEYKIVDVLSNQKSDCSGALRNIENEIKCVLEMVEPKAASKSPPPPSNNKAKSKLASPKFEKTVPPLPPPQDTPVPDSITVKLDDSLLTTEQKSHNANDKMICIYARGPPENNLQISPKKEILNDPVKLTEDLEEPVTAAEGGSKSVEDSESSFTEFQAQPSEKFNCENMLTNFCKQVDTVIKKITMSEESLQTIAAQDEQHESATVQADEFLTPYMRAIKDYRRATKRTRSFMDFLDELNRLSQEGAAVHYHCKNAMNIATVENTIEIRQVARRYQQVMRLEVTRPLRRKTKNRRLQTIPFEEEAEDSSKNQDVQTDGVYSEEDESLHIAANTKDENTQIPSNHQCFTAIENRMTQVTDDLRRLCTHSIDSQVSNLRFKTPSVSAGTEPISPNLPAVTPDNSYDQINDFVCVKPQPKPVKSESCQLTGKVSVKTSCKSICEAQDSKNQDVINIFNRHTTAVLDYFEPKHDDAELVVICNDRVSFGINTSTTKHDLEIANAHKHLLGSVYGVVFTVVFLGLNLQYSC